MSLYKWNVLGIKSNVLLTSEWYQLVTANKVMGLCIQIYKVGISSFALYDDVDHNRNIQSSYSLFFSYPYLILCNLNPHFIVSSIHELLSLSYSFLLVAVPLGQQFFATEIKLQFAHILTFHSFIWLEKSLQHLASQTVFGGKTGQTSVLSRVITIVRPQKQQVVDHWNKLV
jgi:hypothetical protein